MKKTLLIVEDDSLVRESLLDVLGPEGYQITPAGSGEEALEILENQSFEGALLDIKLPGMTGVELLERIREKHPLMKSVIMSSYATIETAVHAIKLGAIDYLNKPIDDRKLKSLLAKMMPAEKPADLSLSNFKADQAGPEDHFHNLVGEDPAMKKIYSVIKAINDTDITVLLKGESGTGKGMIAQAIHYSDPARKDGPYVEVSCGAIPRELLESELFGHVKGAFTSAIRDRVGRFELADGGTILLDEIDALPPYLQVKLLRVIQQKVFEMVGDTKTKRVNVRIIAATNRDLEEEIKAGNFREDLYYRLKVIAVEIPPLRDRKTDIPNLTRHFLRVFNEKQRRSIRGITKEAMEALMAYDWPGNIRELENTLERIVVLSQAEIIGMEHLPENLLRQTAFQSSGVTAKSALKFHLKEPEKKLILEALERAGGNRKKAAGLLNISRTTLYNKIKEYQLF